MKDFKLNKFYILGCGNMAGFLLSSFLENQKLQNSSVVIIHPDKKRRDSLSECFKCEAESLENCTFTENDILFIGLKPKTFLEKSNEIKNAIKGINLTCISIMAILPISTIKNNIGCEKIIRLMPNLAVKIGEGVTGIFDSQESDKNVISFTKYILKDSGIIIDLNSDEEIAAITALSGSGPAFFYYFMEAMIEAGKNAGFSEDLSNQLVKQTISGALNLLNKEDTQISKLREKVTSKGGTTEAGLNVMSSNNVIEIISKTIQAAKDKAI